MRRKRRMRTENSAHRRVRGYAKDPARIYRSLPQMLLLLLFMAGCATQPHRARQYAKAFESFPQREQSMVLRGHFSLGDTREMVYVALGPPAWQSVAVDTAVPGPWRRDFPLDGFIPAGVPLLERWHYRGTPVAHRALLKRDSRAFRTPNDAFYFERPWRSQTQTGRVEVDFHNGRVVRAQWLPGKPPPMRSAPVIRLPQNPLSPFSTPRSPSGLPAAPVRFLPAGSPPGYNFR